MKTITPKKWICLVSVSPKLTMSESIVSMDLARSLVLLGYKVIYLGKRESATNDKPFIVGESIHCIEFKDWSHPSFIANLRMIYRTYQPELFLCQADPHRFGHLVNIRKEFPVPFILNSILDGPPFAEVYRDVFDAFDSIGCLTSITESVLKSGGYQNTSKLTYIIPSYLQHQSKDEALNIVCQNNQDLENHIRSKSRIFTWINRNIARKNLPLLIQAFRQHIDAHPNDLLILHTTTEEPGGHNVMGIINHLNFPSKEEEPTQHSNILISTTTLNEASSNEYMNALYNLSDFILNVANDEGFGLSSLYGAYLNKPRISTNTGGLAIQNPEILVQTETRFYSTHLLPVLEIYETTIKDVVKALDTASNLSEESYCSFAKHAKEQTVYYTVPNQIKDLSNIIKQATKNYEQNKQPTINTL